MRRAIGAAVLVAAAACVDRLPAQDLRILSAVPAAKLSADLLWKEFQSNPAAAHRAYFGRALEITGTATAVSAQDAPDPYILFGQSGARGVRANLLQEQASAILEKSKEQPRLTLRCFVEGLDGDVQLRSCVTTPQ